MHNNPYTATMLSPWAFEAELDAFSERMEVMIIPASDFHKYEMPGGLDRDRLPPGVIPVIGTRRARPATPCVCVYLARCSVPHCFLSLQFTLMRLGYGRRVPLQRRWEAHRVHRSP